MKAFLLSFLLLLTIATNAQNNVPSYVPTNGLVGWWPFSGNADDVSGNSLGGIVNNATFSVDRFGNSNNSFLFQSNNNSYISLPLLTNLQNTFTILMWVKPLRSVNIQNETTVCPGGTSVNMSNTNQNWAVCPNLFSNPSIGVGGLSVGTNGILSAEHGSNILTCRHKYVNTDTNFICVALVYRTDSTFMYVNGSVVVAKAIHCPSTIKRVGGILQLGGNLNAPNFYGVVDDIGVWNRALSANEIGTLYNAPNPCSLSNNLFNQDTIATCGSSYILDVGANYYSYSWNTFDTTQTLGVNNTGWYSCMVSNEFGCTAKDSVYVSIINNQILQSDTSICFGDTILLSSTIPSTCTGLWSNGVNLSSIQIAPNIDTTYYFTLTNGLSTCTDSVHLYVYPLPTNIITEDSLFSCGAITSIVANSGFSQYYWSNGDSSMTTLVNGTDNYICTVKDSNSCKNKDSLFVSLIDAAIYGNDTTVCAGTTTQIKLGGNTINSMYNYQNYYSNNFESGNFNGWINNRLFSFNGTSLMGPYSNESVSYNTNIVEPHDSIKLEFDFYPHDSWDYIEPFQFSLNGLVFSTTYFSLQGYASDSRFTNVNQVSNRCWFGGGNIRKYHAVFYLPHNQNTLNFTINQWNGQDICDESWSFDNFKINVKTTKVHILWSNGDTTTTINVTPATTTTYYCTVNNEISSCVDSYVVNINPLPVDFITQDTIATCGDSLILTSITSFNHYQWSTGDTTQYTYCKSSGWFQLNATNQNGCIGKDSVFASIVKASIAQNDTAICKEKTIHLNIIPTLNSSQFTVNYAKVSEYSPNIYYDYDDFEGGSGSSDDWSSRNGVDPQIVSNTAYSGNYSLYFNNGWGRNFESGVVYESGQPAGGFFSVDFPYMSMAYKIPTTSHTSMLVYITGIGWRGISFTQGEQLNCYSPKVGSWNAGSAIIQDNQWHFKTINLHEQLQQYLGPGNYKIESIIFHDACGSYSVNGEFWIDQFSISSTPPTQYPVSFQWSTGDTSSNINVTPLQTTTYYCTVSNGISSCTDSVMVTVNPLPTNIFSQDTIAACGVNYALAANSGFSFYNWSNGATTQTINASQTGWYKCTVTNASGCSATDSVFVSLVNANIQQNDTSICFANNLSLHVSSGNNFNSINNIGALVGQQFLSFTGPSSYSISYLPYGDYIIEASGTYCLGSCWVGNTIDPAYSFYQTVQPFPNSFSINQYCPQGTSGCTYPRPIVDVYNPNHIYYYSYHSNGGPLVIYGLADECCWGDNIDGLNFKIYEASNNISYQWSNGDTTSTINVSPIQTTTYYCTVSNGISSCTDSVTVTVNPLPTNIFSQDTIAACGVNYALAANSGFSSYNWSNGATTQTITATQTGWYNCTVTNATGCSATDSNFVSLVNANIQQNDTTICAGSSVLLNTIGQYNEGNLTILQGQTYYTDDIRTKITGTNNVGQTFVTVNQSNGFQIGDKVLLVVMQDNVANAYNNVGAYEFSTINTIQGSTISFNTPINHAYSDNNGMKCQMIKVHSFNSVDLYGTMTCSSWNGETGGVLCFIVNNNLYLNNGSVIDANGKGFRGGMSVPSWGGGYQGEGVWGQGVRNYVSNAGGGGGGNAEWCNSGQGGGGGGYINAGNTGGAPCFSCGGGWSFGSCSNSGFGGNAVNNTSSRLILGSGGGSGGVDGDNPDWGGYGGNGGGVIFIQAKQISGNGVVSSNGLQGNDSPGETGGGGGGSGGNIAIISPNPSNILMTANGGIGGKQGDPRFGGNGSNGIINTGLNINITGNSFIWSTGDTTASINVTPTQTTTYYCTVSNGISSCTDSVTVYVNPLPNNIITQDTILVCGAIYSLSTNNGFNTYLWNTNDTTQSININQSGVYNCSVTNQYGCHAVDSTYVSLLSIILVQDDTVICKGATVHLSGIEQFGQLSTFTNYRIWSTGDTSLSIDVTPTNNTTYYCTIGNGLNVCTDSVVINVDSIKYDLFPVDSINICGIPYTLSTINPYNTYNWTNGNINSSIVTNNTGWYKCTVTQGVCSATDSIYLKLAPLPQPTISTTQTSICPNGSTTLTASGGATYLWSNGDTSSTTTVNQAGNYYVIATNTFGCSDTSNMVSITQKTMPTTVKIKYNGASTVCEPANVNYQLDMPLGSTSGFAYQWYLAGTSIPGATDSVFSASASGAYSISVSGGANCFKISPAKPAVVKQQPVANFTAAGPTTICSGELVTLTAPTITGYVYTWLKDGVAVGSGATKSFKLAGNYTVVAKLNGCTDTSSQTIVITVNPLPVAGVTAINNIVFCAGDSCTIAATPNVVGNQYKWFNGNTELTTTSTPSYTVGISGTFKVMVKDTNQCVSKLSSTNIKTKMNPIPVAGINAASSTTISANGSVKLKATPSSGVTWQWYKDGQSLVGATSNQYIATTGGSYTVAITKTGCTGMSAVTTVTQTGVKEETGVTSNPIATEDAQFEITAYPNPVSGQLTINVRGVEEVKATVQVMDFSGKLVATKEMITTSTTVDMTGYASGVYLIRYKDVEGRTGTIKITKE